MRRMTLLDIVQDVLNDLDSDEVNSISDTVEAQQVAAMVKTQFYTMIASRPFSHLMTLGTLESSTDIDRPTHMKLPIGIKDVSWIRYNVYDDDDPDNNIDMCLIKYMTPDQFLMKLSSSTNNTSDEQKIIEDFSGTKFYIHTKSQPYYWTSFDDEYVVFDGYDSDLESTLQTSKTQVYYEKIPGWTTSDSHIPDLPFKWMSLLLAEVKLQATNALKRESNPLLLNNTRSMRRRLTQHGSRTQSLVTFGDFGKRH